MNRLTLLTLAGLAAASLSLGACEFDEHGEGYDHHPYAERYGHERHGVRGDENRYEHSYGRGGYGREWHDYDVH